MSSQFERELGSLINRFSIENDTDTPDFILAGFLIDCLKVIKRTIHARDGWYGQVSALRSVYLQVSMPDKSLWEIPAEVVALHRAKHRLELFKNLEESLAEDTVPLFVANPQEIIWWTDQMSWKEVEASAYCVASLSEVEGQNGWDNGHKEIVRR